MVKFSLHLMPRFIRHDKRNIDRRTHSRFIHGVGSPYWGDHKMARRKKIRLVTILNIVRDMARDLENGKGKAIRRMGAVSALENAARYIEYAIEDKGGTKMAKVYIKTNENNEITEIGSSVFITDPENWIEIDEGFGDKYVHAQGNYLPGPTLDEEGRPNFAIRNGEIVPTNHADNAETPCDAEN